MFKKLQDTVALVTGASSGIGEATARRLAAQGATVALVARRRDRLENLASELKNLGGEVLVIETDITDKKQAEHAVQQVIHKYGRLDTVINNAGLMLIGGVAETPSIEWERMISVNINGLLYISHAALPYLIQSALTSERKVTDLINISSVSGRKPSAGQAVYSLTKSGVAAFTEALRQETAGLNVRVAVLEPGAVGTELGNHLSDDVRKQLSNVLSNIEVLEAEDIAETIEFIVTRPRRVAVNEILVRPTDQAM
ncbi:NADP-dependent 3-hydroxy acid dehydrogenase YdfG [Paenibacillus amylolyticus]|uniref:NADP-dependent 3-hydroxy acid dehydrogenase YdfG n=1 Tax=Paenibacillus amylolyticus TaxID=1451 RepID=A0AAP5LRJ2_PAEAM|nr:SDR family NAD(P)-dependent oxidoreductase [Paenibacillus amylolyticus]MDR6724489.1 NADP-dependent 3-hydroxy acid dehydrogenase YdfG [Paenibacillus amylolyticus]